MLTVIPDLLDDQAVTRVRALIDAAQWVDGNVTSGHQSALAKHNLQLPEDSAEAKQAGQIVLDALGRSPLFIAAALPLKVFPPLFNSYAGGQAFGSSPESDGCSVGSSHGSKHGRTGTERILLCPHQHHSSQQTR